MVNVKADVLQCFNEATDLLRFATEAYIIAMALECLGCKSVEEKPGALNNGQDPKTLLYDVSRSIVEKCYIPPDYDRILRANVNDNELFPYCVCKEDTGEDMIACDYKGCPSGSWFHFSCYNIKEEDTTAELWFCSDKCRLHILSKVFRSTEKHPTPEVGSIRCGS